MSRYTGPRLKIMRALGTPLPGLSSKSIAVHFRFVANDPRYADILRNAAERLGMEWQGLLDAADHDGRVH